MQCRLSITRRVHDGRYLIRCVAHPDITFTSYTFDDVANWGRHHVDLVKVQQRQVTWRDELPVIILIVGTILGLTALGLLAVFYK